MVSYTLLTMDSHLVLQDGPCLSILRSSINFMSFQTEISSKYSTTVIIMRFNTMKMIIGEEPSDLKIQSFIFRIMKSRRDMLTTCIERRSRIIETDIYSMLKWVNMQELRYFGWEEKTHLMLLWESSEMMVIRRHILKIMMNSRKLSMNISTWNFHQENLSEITIKIYLNNELIYNSTRKWQVFWSNQKRIWNFKINLLLS